MFSYVRELIRSCPLDKCNELKKKSVTQMPVGSVQVIRYCGVITPSHQCYNYQLGSKIIKVMNHVIFC